LRPGVTGAESIDAIFGAPAVVEGHRHLAAGIAAVCTGRNPVYEFRRVKREPFLVHEPVEQPRLAIQESLEASRNPRVLGNQFITLPIGIGVDQLGVTCVTEIMRGARGVVFHLRHSGTAHRAGPGIHSPCPCFRIPGSCAIARRIRLWSAPRNDGNSCVSRDTSITPPSAPRGAVRPPSAVSTLSCIRA
jgi:hypothetical protein